MHTISFSIFRLDKLCCYSSQKRLALFETQYKTNVILFFCFFSLVEFSLEYRICLFKKKKKKVISVYVDVGECTDAIQHKDRGDFQVTGITLVYLLSIFLFASLWLPYI